MLHMPSFVIQSNTKIYLPIDSLTPSLKIYSEFAIFITISEYFTLRNVFKLDNILEI